ncbi:glycosyltransferase family 4 protein [Paenibacillus puldeungensis]|uniref:Glycosyltransferase family 4 protein n=1 Tax=Paenibacillus puldeungensis TaxID=696536 RepID=A0ABW3S2F6_9BACL
MTARVLFVFYVPSGGMETVNRQRCQALRRHGIQAECLYYEWGAGLQNKVDFPVYITNSDEEIRRIIQERNFDTIVVTTDHTSFERFRRLGYKGKLILEIQGYGAVETAEKQLREAASAVHAHASALMNPNTPHIAALFRNYYSTIPQFHYNNCFDTRFFAYRPSGRPKFPILAWIGRIEDNKNWREFLYIAHSLLFYYENLQVWMFEDHHLSRPDERKQFVHLAEQLQLTKALQLRSNVPNQDMVSYFSQIGDSGGLFCCTSKVEGAPLSILEAMSCRCPVLASNSDGVQSSVIHNVTGKIYPLGDIGQAVLEARELMYHSSFREGIRKRAQQHVLNEFHPDKYCRQFIEMLRSI